MFLNKNKKKKPFTTSKKIAWTWMIFFFLTCVAVGFVNVNYGVCLSYIIYAEMPVIMVIVPFYYSKSYLENKERFKYKEGDKDRQEGIMTSDNITEVMNALQSFQSTVSPLINQNQSNEYQDI